MAARPQEKTVTIHPTRNQIIVRVDTQPRVKSRIVNPTSAVDGEAWKDKDKPGYFTGVIMAVGPGFDMLISVPGNSAPEVRHIPVNAKVGEVVLFCNHWNNSEIEIDGDAFRILDEANIVAVITK